MSKHADTTHEDKKTQFAGLQKNIEAFSYQEFNMMFETPSPYVILKEATRRVSISHWGNIQIDEFFKLENIGAKVKGQYSRYDMDINKGGRNCLRNLHSEYPYYIKGLYVFDYIGNISSTHAARTNTQVEMDLKPRYPICGGW